MKNESSSRVQRVGASFALKRIHAPEVVDSLEKHLNDPKDNLFIHAFEILARLYYKEKDWDDIDIMFDVGITENTISDLVLQRAAAQKLREAGRYSPVDHSVSGAAHQMTEMH